MRLSNGFSMIELIAVIVIVGILSAVVSPKFFDADAFNQRGFHDETLAMLRYAQKSAIAQRRTVCVAYTLSSATLSIAPVADSSVCAINLAGPNGTTPFLVTAGPRVFYNPVPTSFSFNALGVPSLGQTFFVSGDSKSITVEAQTGYIHE
jgi:MSHA pilin protein MshC